MRAGYREDIDWLRAIAVLAVVAFHFEAPVYGGFVGVDIFFVISGYLITGIIQAELKNGTFSFAQFYERRVRRLLPALYVMVALSAVPSFHYLLTSERAEFFRSAAAVVTFTSNVFFWFRTGYFDPAASEKPLLHTWSLAVEEQFYLVLPVALWALWLAARGRRFAWPAFLVGLALASFVLSIWLMKSGRSATAFFLSPPRAWEFLIGGIVAVEGFPAPRLALTRSIVRGAALIMLAIAIFGLRQGPGFPGFFALTPCIGAALFIWSGIGMPGKARPAYAPLETVRFFGLISYSLYLWHWPLFTFAHLAKDGLVLNAADKLVLFGVTVAIAFLSWRYVERPFRARRLAPTRRGAFAVAGVASVGLLVAGALGLTLGRTPSGIDRIARQLESYQSYDYSVLYRSGTCFGPSGGVFGPDCLRLAAGQTNWLLWGDSFAAQYYHGLRKVADQREIHLLQATQAACMPTLDVSAPGDLSCRQLAKQMQTFFGGHKPDLVIMSADWLEYGRGSRFDRMIADLAQTVAALEEKGIAVALLGPSVQFRARLPSILIRARLREERVRSEDSVLPNIFSYDRRMEQALSHTTTFSFVSVVDAVCPAQRCPLMIGEGVPFSFDHAHLTAEGSVFVADSIAPLLPPEKTRTSE